MIGQIIREIMYLRKVNNYFRYYNKLFFVVLFVKLNKIIDIYVL